MPKILEVTVLRPRLALTRFSIGTPLPTWSAASEFLCYVRSYESTTIISLEDALPKGVEAERDWRMLRIEGEFDFDQSGILAALAVPLGEAKIPTLVVSTFETDYVLVKSTDLERAIAVLRAHSVVVREDEAAHD